jgi:hypothetical protein
MKEEQIIPFNKLNNVEIKLHSFQQPFYLSMSLMLLWTLAVFQFLNLYAVSRTLYTGDQPVARPLHTQGTAQTQNKRIQTSMHRLRFETTITVFERAKTFRALGRADIVIGYSNSL